VASCRQCTPRRLETVDDWKWSGGSLTDLYVNDTGGGPAVLEFNDHPVMAAKRKESAVSL